MDDDELQGYLDKGVCPECSGLLFEYDNGVVECEECAWSTSVRENDDDDDASPFDVDD